MVEKAPIAPTDIVPERSDSGDTPAPIFKPQSFGEIALDFTSKINSIGVKNSPLMAVSNIGSERFASTRRLKRRGRSRRTSLRRCGQPKLHPPGCRCGVGLQGFSARFAI